MSSSCTQTETPSEARFVNIDKLCIGIKSGSRWRQELKKLWDPEDLVPPSSGIKKPSTSPRNHLGSPSPVGLKQTGPSPDNNRPKRPIYYPEAVPGAFSYIDDSVFRRVNAVYEDEDESGVGELTGDVQCVDCFYCKESHPSIWYNCPKKPCTMCFKLGQHESHNCPYKCHIPKGAEFDRVKFEMICTCGNLFNEDRWVCTCCPGTSPMLIRKFCNICDRKAEHGTHECPKDLVRAAKWKVIRDHRLLVGNKRFSYSSKT